MKKIESSTFQDYAFLSNLVFSKGGSKLAYTLKKANIEENSYDSFVYVYDLAKKEGREMTSSKKDANLFWINEEELLIQSQRNPKLAKKREEGEAWTEYFSLSTQGGEAKPYLELGYDVSALKDGGDVFYFTASYSPLRPPLQDYEGEARSKEIAKRKEEEDYEVLDEIPFWLNGEGFTNKKRNRLYVYDKKTKEVKAISQEDMNVEFFETTEKGLLFIATKFQDKMELQNAIYAYDKREGLKTVMPEGDYNYSYVNVLDGKIFCAASDMKAYGLNENHKLYFVKDEKLELFFANDTWLVPTVGTDCHLGGGRMYAVQDGYFYFLATRKDAAVLNRVDGKGNLEILTEGEGSVDMFDLVGDQISYVAMKNYGLQEVYYGNFEKQEQITEHNAKIFEDYSVQKPEKFYFDSHGEALEVYVIKPLGYEKGKKYPGILDIHGGPKTVYGNVFYHEMQLWANAGYFVFFTNPHGSDGRGNAFMDIRGKYGGIDYEDLMKATDLVLERYPDIDITRLGVTGGSYGGFMTNWIIGHTNRFAAAASQRSISNWVSKFGITDIGYYFNADQNLATPWDNVEKLWQHSPLKYADKATTPTLFIHSEEDYRCALEEGIQMFTALKYHGVEARLCMFRGENHELSRSGKPKHRLRRLNEISTWFDKYLKK